jgi:hypothetical protein
MAEIKKKKPKHRRMYNIKIKPFKKGCCDVNWIEPVKFRKFTV